MKAVRARVRKMHLFGGTKCEAVSGAGPDEPDLDEASQVSWAGPTAIAVERRPPQRRITRVSRGDLVGLYDVGWHVAESAHPVVEVRFGRRRCNGEQVVIKTREKSASFKGAREEREWRRAAAAQPNMAKGEGMCEYLAVYETREKYFFVMGRGMDLFDHIRQGHVDQEGAREILLRVLGALRAVHASGGIHGDLRLEDVVADMPPRESPTEMCAAPVAAKLVDFDTVEDWKPLSPEAKGVLGTAGCIAPEAHSGDHSPASDIFSAGVVMYRLLTGRSPLGPADFSRPPGENWVGSPATRRVRDRLGGLSVDFERPPLNRLPDAQDLLRRMMALDADERPSAAEALEHPWFRHAGEGRRPSDASTSAGSSRAPSAESSKSAAGSAPATPVRPSILAVCGRLDAGLGPSVRPSSRSAAGEDSSRSAAAAAAPLPTAEGLALPGVPE